MKISIITAALPPKLDGIGDYTANLARELAKHCEVSILTSFAPEHTPIPGVKITPLFPYKQQPSQIKNIIKTMVNDPPDWVILQYNPFAYGRWGLNMHLPAAIAKIKRLCPQTRFALMVHEPFVPILDWKHAAMTTWQRWQMWKLGRSAEVVFFSIEPWVKRFRNWFPQQQLAHLPTGSNIPLMETAREAERKRLNIGDDVVVLGYFGTFHNFRMPNWVGDAAKEIIQSGRKTLVLYIGPHKEDIRKAVGDIPLLAEGPLSAVDVSKTLAAVDIYLAPFLDGVSTRRTTLLSALQHGLPSVATMGYHTDTVLKSEDGEALMLAKTTSQASFNQKVIQLVEDKLLRTKVSENARVFYHNNFSWPIIVQNMLQQLGSTK